MRAKKRPYKCLTWLQRLELERLMKAKLPIKQIALTLGVHISTVYRELKRGECELLNYDWTTRKDYSPQIAEEKRKVNATARGAGLKIGNDYALANYIEKRIVDDGLSPLAVIGEIRHNKIPFATSICVKTLYNYIAKGVFLRLTLDKLPFRGKRVKPHRKVQAAKLPRGESIEKRPAEIAERKTFGHWEMDCIVGKREAGKVFLTLSERLTRKEIILLMPNRKAESVVNALDILERRYKDAFPAIFKSITVDNGAEFSDCQRMERRNKDENRQRPKKYDCRPYSSYERGTNERLNREIRRKCPKGTDFESYSQEDVQRVEDWVNAYPRGVLGFETSAFLFENHISNIN